MHYVFAIAALNKMDLNDIILEKDKKASVKYNHARNLEQFLEERYKELSIKEFTKAARQYDSDNAGV